MSDAPLELLTRRDAFLGMSALALTLPLQGCILPLLRLFVSRGAARALVGAGKIGRTSAALTFGRGISVGSRIGRLQTSSFPPANVIGPRGHLVAESRAADGGVSVFIDRAKVFRSVEQPFGYRHYDSNGPAGYSYHQRDGTVVHKSEDGLVTAVDRFKRASRIIEHLDDNGNVIGQTSVRQSGDGVSIDADGATLSHIEAIRTELGLQCPDARSAREELLVMKDRCLTEGGEICKQVPYQEQKYRFLKAKCRP